MQPQRARVGHRVTWVWQGRDEGWGACPAAALRAGHRVTWVWQGWGVGGRPVQLQGDMAATGLRGRLQGNLDVMAAG